MARFDSKIEIEISTVLNNYFSVFHLIHKDVAEINLALLVALHRIRLATKEDWVRKYITYSFYIDENRTISSHDIAVYIVVESLRRFRFKYDLDFYLSLRRNNTRHRLDNQWVSILQLSSDRLFVKVEC